MPLDRWKAPNQARATPWLRADWDHLSRFLDRAYQQTVSDDLGFGTVFVSNAARDAAIPSPTEGMFVTVTGDNQIQHYDGTGWVAWDRDWVDYSPTLTNLTLGSGTLFCQRRRAGFECWTNFSFTLGAGSAVGTTPTVSLPFTAVDPFSEIGVTSKGIVSLLDSGTAQMEGVTRLASTTTYTIHVNSGVGATPNIRIAASTISATVPFTWIAPDRIDVQPWAFRLASPYV